MPVALRAGTSKTADHTLDLGPYGGVRGGEVVAEGTLEEVAAVPGSYTGRYLAPMLTRAPAQAAASGRKAKEPAE